MFNQVTRIYDGKNVRRSLSRQKKIAEHSIPFGYSTSYAFARSNVPDTYAEFMKWSNNEMTGGTFFDAFGGCEVLYESGNKIAFRSDIETDHDSNNDFVCIYDSAERADHAVIVVNHWFAESRYSAFAKYLNTLGLSVLQVPLPYHFERRRDVLAGEQRTLCADVGITLHSFRQAVLDCRKTVKWLRSKGYRKISIVGFCLGGVVAGLVAAKDQCIDNAVVSVSAGSVADAVWTGETLSILRQRISDNITLDELRTCWALINLENYTYQLTRPDLSLMFLLGRDDTVVKPEVSQRLIDALGRDEGDPYVRWLPCGHSSIGMFPFNVIAARSIGRFLQPKTV